MTQMKCAKDSSYSAMGCPPSLRTLPRCTALKRLSLQGNVIDNDSIAMLRAFWPGHAGLCIGDECSQSEEEGSGSGSEDSGSESEEYESWSESEEDESGQESAENP